MTKFKQIPMYNLLKDWVITKTPSGYTSYDSMNKDEKESFWKWCQNWFQER